MTIFSDILHESTMPAFVTGWDDIGYSFLVGEDGRVYEGRGWTHLAAQSLHYNEVSFGIAIMGDFMTILPQSKALDAVNDIIACGVDKVSNVDVNYVTSLRMRSKLTSTCTSTPLYLVLGLPVTRSRTERSSRWPKYFMSWRQTLR